MTKDRFTHLDYANLRAGSRVIDDCISVIETAGRLDGEPEAWLAEIAQCARRASPLFENAFCFLYDIRDLGGVRIVAGATAGDPGALDLIARTDAVAPPEVRMAAYLSRPVDTFSGLCGDDSGSEAALQVLREAGYADVIGVVGGDPTGFGCLLGGLLHQRTKASRETRHHWSRVAAHIATAYRTRRGMGGDVLDAADVVLSPNGQVEHAAADATGDRGLTALRHAAWAADRARGRLRNEDLTEAIEIWEAMVAGRWSLTETFDTDGRRFFVARDVEPVRDTPVELSPRERQVAALAALGHPQKLIGYELGLSSSTVSSHLAGALAKLNMRSRADLIGFFLGPAGVPGERPT